MTVVNTKQPISNSCNTGFRQVFLQNTKPVLNQFQTTLRFNQTYIDWSLHEPRPGVFDFEGEKALEQFLQLAQDNDLFVILRPGPYIDAGRIDRWSNKNNFELLNKPPGLPRSSNPTSKDHIYQFSKIV